MTNEPGRSSRRALTDATVRATVERRLAELLDAANVPAGLTHDQAVTYLAGIGGKLDAVMRLVVSWEPHAAVGVTLQPDYRRGRADTYRDVIAEVRAALNLPAR